MRWQNFILFHLYISILLPSNLGDPWQNIGLLKSDRWELDTGKVGRGTFVPLKCDKIGNNIHIQISMELGNIKKNKQKHLFSKKKKKIELAVYFFVGRAGRNKELINYVLNPALIMYDNNIHFFFKFNIFSYNKIKLHNRRQILIYMYEHPLMLSYWWITT
jgi:hypothetical protein